MEARGTLIFFCGKMGAGKTSMSRKIAQEKNAVLLSEDVWLAQLYPGQIASFKDYLGFSRQMRPLVRDLAQDVLRTGTNLVMDFPGNTVSQRAWFTDLCCEIHCPHEMIYLAASDDVCLQHIAKRRQEQPERAAMDTPETFIQVTAYFEEPAESEQLNIRKIAVGQ